MSNLVDFEVCEESSMFKIMRGGNVEKGTVNIGEKPWTTMKIMDHKTFVPIAWAKSKEQSIDRKILVLQVCIIN